MSGAGPSATHDRHPCALVHCYLMANVPPVTDIEEIVAKLASLLVVFQQLLHDNCTDTYLFASVSKKINQWSSRRFHMVCQPPAFMV